MSRRIWTLTIALGCLTALALGRHTLGHTDATEVLRLPALEAFDAIVVQRRGQDDVRLQLKNGRWTQEPGARPLAATVEKLLNKTFEKTIESDQMVSLETIEPRVFSVSSSAPLITIEKNGEALSQFRVGKRIDERRTFIRVADQNRVFRVKADLRQVFDRRPLDWRKRRIFGRQPDDLASITSQGGDGRRWTIMRQDPHAPWTMPAQPAMPVAQQAANAVANTLTTLQVAAFYDGRTLQDDGITLRAKTFDGQELSLALERPTENGDRRGQANGKGPVVLIPRHQAIFLTPNMDELRNRKLFDFTASEIVEVVYSGPPRIHLRRDAGEKWVMVAPESRGPLSDLIMDKALAILSSLQTVGFPRPPEKNPMEVPFCETSAKLVDGREVVVTVGAPYGTKGARYAESTVRTGELYVLPAAVIEGLRPRPDDFGRR
jgi:hypothetical protein